ncbi:MAG: preprotein translocase subunit SecY [Thermoprotei archaeon]|nr:MAG: preprotein translocase subunit SecY [Thermoprotei archaeon]
MNKAVGAYETLQPIFRILPEVKKPARKLSLRERLFWTGIILIIYFAMSQVPLYGIPWAQTQYQQLFFLQVIMASRRGTLLELGIGPIVTAGLIWQLLVGSKIVDIDLTTPEGRKLFSGVEKLFAIIFAAIEALAYIVGGAYGVLSFDKSAAVFAQLFVASVIILLMDELLQKGWGIGSGISLFIAAGVAQQIFWELFSPIGPMEDGLYYGVMTSLIYSIYMGATTGNWTLLPNVLARQTGFPDVMGFLTMIFFILLLAYMESMRIEIPITVSRYGGMRSKIPLKFLYVSNLPVILVSALYADIHIFAQALWPRFNAENTNPWFNIIAKYNRTETGLIPLQGSLVYYISPPRSLWAIFRDPVHVAVYAFLFIGFSVLFAIAWVETSGMDPWSQAQQLVEAGLQIPGFRKSTRILSSLFSRYIWPLTILSGLLIGVIAVVSDLFGVLGSGIGILLMVGILVQYQQLLAREQALEMYPLLAKVLGE